MAIFITFCTAEEDIILILDDHIAVSPNPAQAHSERGTDSGLEEPVTYDGEVQESDDENLEIDVVATSMSEQEEEIIVDPTTIEACSEVGPQTPTRQIRGQVKSEHNNNGEEGKVSKVLSTSRLQSPHNPNKQLLLHGVPISFPVPGNLMESIGAQIFINEALLSLMDDLPSDVIIDATPMNQVGNHQARQHH